MTGESYMPRRELLGSQIRLGIYNPMSYIPRHE